VILIAANSVENVLRAGAFFFRAIYSLS